MYVRGNLKENGNIVYCDIPDYTILLCCGTIYADYRLDKYCCERLRIAWELC